MSWPPQPVYQPYPPQQYQQYQQHPPSQQYPGQQYHPPPQQQPPTNIVYLPPPPTLAPLPRPTGVLPAFARHTTEIQLKLREKLLSWSGDDFTIDDALTGAPIFRLAGKTLTFHGRKQLTDVHGQPLLDLAQEPLHLVHSVFSGTHPATRAPLFHIRSRFSWKTKLDITFAACADGRETQLFLEGDWLARQAAITLDGVPVARIDRQIMNARQWLFDQQTYVLTVAPGMDAALMVAICICMDELSDRGGTPSLALDAAFIAL